LLLVLCLRAHPLASRDEARVLGPVLNQQWRILANSDSS
jgi:hypothetical protein